MKRIILFLTLATFPAYGQTVTTPQVAAMVCANNTIVPNPVNSQFFYVQCDSSGRLITTASTIYAPIASPTFTGTVTMPDSSAFAIGGWTNGVLVGITNPAINTTPLTVSGFSSGNADTHSLANLSGTWNVGAGNTAGTAILLNITNTTSAAASLLADLQVGGVSQFKVTRGGAATFAGAGTFAGNVTATGSSVSAVNITASGALGFSNGTNFTSPVLSTVQFGNPDAAVAVAQTTKVQSVIAGTAAANGANWTVIGSLPTGTGTSGDIILQTGVKTGSGTTQGTPTTALTIKGETQQTTFAGQVNVTAMTQTSAAQNGTVCYNSGTGAITYDATLGCLTSTMRVKHDIRPLGSTLAKVMALEPSQFYFNADMRVPGEQVGLIAESVAEVDPRLVGYDAEGKPRGWSESAMIATLVGAVKEQQAEIDALKVELHR